MMKTLYLDLSMGAAGDMLTAALYELLDDDGRKEFLEAVNGLGLSDVEVRTRKVEKCGVTGTSVDVLINGRMEDEHHHHEDHEHKHEHEHSHHSMDDISLIIDGLRASGEVKNKAKEIYKVIAQAESTAHGVPVSEVHFHEVGAVDAIVDVTSVCILMEMLAPDRVFATDICVGYGTVECAHGILPVPAPATANILKGLPAYPGETEGEMCTPTGAALIRSFVDEFGTLPSAVPDRTGHGMGKRDYGVSSALSAFIMTT
ncbi:MAG: LarC family nickel insertion protein [Lachnospiraceae bacterium]|nr:LarC family nickel insertion protein [Lachnospiraceae bacterium]